MFYLCVSERTHDDLIDIILKQILLSLDRTCGSGYCFWASKPDTHAAVNIVGQIVQVDVVLHGGEFQQQQQVGASWLRRDQRLTIKCVVRKRLVSVIFSSW